MKIKLLTVFAAIAIIIPFSIIIGQGMLEDEIKDAITQTIDSFDGKELSSIDNLQFGDHYTFVLSPELDEILAHPNQNLVGTEPTGVNNANFPVDKIIDRLEDDGNVWIEYEFLNPDNDKVQHKRALLVLENNLVFGSGYYLPFS